MNVKNIILLVIGFISLSVGAVGIFLPVLPTTPFVLLSVGCFSASSPRLADRLTKNRVFGNYIQNYRYHTGVPRKSKIRAVIFLWAGLLISVIIIKTLLMACILTLVGVSVTIHIMKLKTRT